MLWCVLPTVWAGVGPGSLIYQAALKSVPEELFEAAAMDGGGFFSRLRYVALPYIKPLVVMNFVGAFVGAFKSSGYILILTGGGPDGATTVVSLEIFYEAYARLRFGTATAMSWVLAFLLIGFTLFQIRYLSRIEFRSAGTSA
jgi:multiple sugar transport system permease protein